MRYSKEYYPPKMPLWEDMIIVKDKTRSSTTSNDNRPPRRPAVVRHKNGRDPKKHSETKAKVLKPS